MGRRNIVNRLASMSRAVTPVTQFALQASKSQQEAIDCTRSRLKGWEW